MPTVEDSKRGDLSVKPDLDNNAPKKAKKRW